MILFNNLAKSLRAVFSCKDKIGHIELALRFRSSKVQGFEILGFNGYGLWLLPSAIWLFLPESNLGTLNRMNPEPLSRMAEREGFEPSVPLLTAHTISSRAPSASSDISPKKNLQNFFI
jgi:hypothetical protein